MVRPALLSLVALALVGGSLALTALGFVRCGDDDAFVGGRNFTVTVIDDAFVGGRNFTVTVIDDAVDGACDASHCSLREAMMAANEGDGVDTIAFAIPGEGPHEIHPESKLPDITNPVVIDGLTQPGSDERLQVGINGVFVGGDTAVGLRVTSGSSTIRGLMVVRWERAGIELAGAGGSSIEGNYIGADVPGQPPRGNGQGIKVSNSRDNRIGGADSKLRNVISGNLVNGVLIEGAESSGNVVAGNYIGIAADGELGLGNGLDGVAIVDAPANVVGGPGNGGNVIGANGSNGVRVFGATATGNRIVGNLIGTASDGLTARGNRQKGVWLMAPGNVVGGAADGEGNLIVRSAQAGVIIQGPNAHDNVVQGNVIGTDLTASAPLPNRRFGVRVLRAGPNLIGGESPGAGNVIALNDLSGVVVEESTGVAVLGNSIWGNFELAIDLRPSIGANENDPDDSDTGANELQNFPVLERATATGEVSGVLDSQPNRTFRIEIFLNPTCDGSRHGEGEIFKGHVVVTTDDAGHASFETKVDPSGGSMFAATATDASNNTSEFSRCLRIEAA